MNKVNVVVPTLTTTRWNSMFLLLNKIYENRQILIDYKEMKSKEYSDNLEKYKQSKLIGVINEEKTKEDALIKYIPKSGNLAYVILEKMKEILKPLYQLTITLENRSITMGMAILHYKKAIYELNTDDYPMKIKEYAETIKKYMVDRLEVMTRDSDIPLLCVMLDPRSKQFIITLV